MDIQILNESTWQRLAKEHRDSMRCWTEPFRARRKVGRTHPIHDFLFVYYQNSSKKIEQWHPGVGVRLEDAARQGAKSSFWPTCFSQHYRTIGNDLICDPSRLEQKLIDRLRWIESMLRQTASRKPNFACFGLHEWAMVYKGKQVRHEKTAKLRISQSAIDQLVESRPLTCSHFDAFRFFAIDAQPLNRIKPTLEGRPEIEQPGCIHANMDLYKWAFKSMPFVGSDLLARCFALAMEARVIDMRASPYDLTEFGNYPAIMIEKSEGRIEYEELQQTIAKQAEPLRFELAEKINQVIKLTTVDVLTS